MATRMMPSMGVGSNCGEIVSSTAFRNHDVKCQLDAGFSFFLITELPTANEMVQVCASASCMAVIAAIKEAVPSECAISWMWEDFKLYKDILDPIDAVCGKQPTDGTMAPSTPSTPSNGNDEGVTQTPCAMELTDIVVNGACATDSGFSFDSPNTSPPTEYQVPLICKSANCISLLNRMHEVAPDECTIGDGLLLYRDLLNPIIWNCPGVNATDATTTTTMAPATTSAPAKKETSSGNNGRQLTATTLVVLVLSVSQLMLHGQ